MAQKTILIIDDEQGFVEALDDALKYEGYRVLKASTAEDALRICQKEKIDLATVDIMLPQGKSLESKVDSHRTGMLICEQIRKQYPKTFVFCISVINDKDSIQAIEKMGVRFLRKGETPLRTVLDMVRSAMTGIAYSTERKIK